VAIRATTLEIEDVDVVDGTPLIDIKPYVPAFDDRSEARVGWFTERLGDLATATADDRFRR
jgi:tRNA (Thr-GGU) A37 N-methylase